MNRENIQELDVVALTRDFSAQGLAAGDVGTVVHAYTNGPAFEVEFVTAAGQMVALLTLTPADIRPMTDPPPAGSRERE